MALKAIDGIPILDAKYSITLHITKSDCSNSDPKHPESCAAARSIRRVLKPIDCRVHLGRIYIRQNKGNWLRYNTPPALRNEIIAFDRGGVFSPGEYVIKPLPPSQLATLGKRQGGEPKFKQARNNPNRKKRKSPHIVKNVRNGPA